VSQRCYQLNVKENDVLLREIKGDVIVEEQSTVHAKGYAESITVLSSTTNKAPELIIEEDEMDEDGDEDDDIDDDLNICSLCD
jgi:singapore isolate B (sub-type 7) whole genome shotgun sequence assembly, scaffold_0